MNTLVETTVALEINSLWQQTEASMQQTLILAAMTGEALNKSLQFVNKAQGKASGGHKEWLSTNCPNVSYDRAIKYMKLPEQFPELLTDRASFIKLLPVSSVLLLLSSSAEVKAEVKEKVESGEKMTQAKIAELNAKHKEDFQKVQRLHEAQLDALRNTVAAKIHMETKDIKATNAKLKADVAAMDQMRGEYVKMKSKMADKEKERETLLNLIEALKAKSGGPLDDLKLKNLQKELVRKENEIIALQRDRQEVPDRELKNNLITALNGNIKLNEAQRKAVETLLLLL
jgi:hypothetical protein